MKIYNFLEFITEHIIIDNDVRSIVEDDYEIDDNEKPKNVMYIASSTVQNLEKIFPFYKNKISLIWCINVNALGAYLTGTCENPIIVLDYIQLKEATINDDDLLEAIEMTIKHEVAHSIFECAKILNLINSDFDEEDECEDFAYNINNSLVIQLGIKVNYEFHKLKHIIDSH